MIKKINFYHSLIFFITSIILSAFAFLRDNNLILICLFLILTLGISHGSLDNIKGNIYEGEFLIIQKKKILRYAKWPENIWGYETIRHWEINRLFDYPRKLIKTSNLFRPLCQAMNGYEHH